MLDKATRPKVKRSLSRKNCLRSESIRLIRRSPVGTGETQLNPLERIIAEKKEVFLRIIQKGFVVQRPRASQRLA